MKAVLICPGQRPAVARLAETCPLALAPLLGKCLVEYWIEHLVASGVREISLSASDRPEAVAELVGDGARWGLPIAVWAEEHELSPQQAAARYSDWPEGEPEFVELMDHLPGLPELRLLESYATWFAALQAWMPQAQALERIGHCEAQPGVWLGLRTRIDPAARLVAPCWLGDYVAVNGGAVIGPGAILEDGVVVAAGARVARSVIGPATFVGAQTLVENSLAHRRTLINWSTNSCLRVPDAFWLSSLSEPLAATRREKPPATMKIERQGAKLSITALAELSAANATWFREAIHAALASSPTVIEVDCSQTRFVDSWGLATLFNLQRSAAARGIVLRLMNPDPSVHQLLELTQMRQFFEVGEPLPAAEPPDARAASRRFARVPTLVPTH